MRSLIIGYICIGFVSFAYAQPMVFNRATLIITSHQPQQASQTSTNQDNVNQVKTSPSEIKFSVEIKNSQALEHDMLINSAFSDKTGILILFDEPSYIHVPLNNKVLVSRDLLFIDEENTINEIIPFTDPKEQKTIVSENLAIALLQLNAGDTTLYDINIGDHVTTIQ